MICGLLGTIFRLLLSSNCQSARWYPSSLPPLIASNDLSNNARCDISLYISIKILFMVNEKSETGIFVFVALSNLKGRALDNNTLK
jgi:hypothetical protein